MNTSRRTFLAGIFALQVHSAERQVKRLIIDAHCHAGHGQAMTAPWTTFNDPEVTLGHMTEAGINRTIIFPIENPDYEKPNQEIAEICSRYSGKFIGFAKHDPESEKGRIRGLLRHEVEELRL